MESHFVVRYQLLVPVAANRNPSCCCCCCFHFHEISLEIPFRWSSSLTPLSLTPPYTTAAFFSLSLFLSHTLTPTTRLFVGRLTSLSRSL